MEVKLSTGRGVFSAELKLPRAWVISAVLAIGTLVGNGVKTWLDLREVKAKLAECEKRINVIAPVQGEP